MTSSPNPESKLIDVPKKELYQCVFSDDRKYRYVLANTWDRSLPRIAFIGLNPSTADEYKLDPTVTRCSKWAKQWGYGELVMLNLFAFRSPHPKVMKAEAEPEGRDNNMWIRRICGASNMIVCVWGNDGAHGNRGEFVISLLNGILAHPSTRELHCLGLTKDGFPIHPAARGKHRLPDNIQPQIFRTIA